MSELKLRPPETREKIPGPPQKARGALGYKACAAKFVNFGICY
jgi:hypothetical protein